jgi:hypothetical protein
MGTRAGVLAAGGVLALLVAACQAPAPPPPSSMSLGWHASGINGPIAADPAENLLWAMNKGTGTLTALDASTGGVRAQHVVAMDAQEHFPTPAVVPNWVLIESGHHVVAFSTPEVASATSWTSALLDGIVQARPLVVNGIVVVATENDSLYGLRLGDGTTAWGPVSIGGAEPLSHVQTFPGLGGCGDLDPLGITSNPVLDNGSVYAVGEVSTGTGAGAHPPVHKLAGLDPATGLFTLNPIAIDPPGMNPPAEQQRAGLVAGNGHVYIGFGGLAGDCGSYHGWIVAANESDGSVAGSLEVAAASNAGAVWATSGPTLDSAGNVYASTGNGQGSPNPGTDYSDAVVRVSPSISGAQTVPADYFQPAEWRSDNAADADLGSAGPVLLPSGSQLFIIGKQHNAFVLNTSSLGGGDHLTPASRLNNACSGGAFGQNAVLASSAYVACSTGMQQVHLP